MLSMQEVLNSIENPSTKTWKSKKIRLIGSQIQPGELKLITKTLKEHDSVRSLEICLCDLPEESVIEFSKELKESSLVLLQLVHVGVNNRSATALATAVQECGLKKLDLTFNQISEGGAKALAASLNDCGLEMLLLGRNSIGPCGAKAFAESLSTGSTSLKSLDLRMNNIGNEGAIALVKVLPKTSLQFLHLDSNNIGDETIIELCAVLPQSPLETLCLGMNQLEDYSLCKLANVLNKTKLRKLSLNGNRFGLHGMKALAKAVKDNEIIEFLDLRQNPFDDEAAMVLYEAIATHGSIRNILLHESQTSSLIKELFEKRLKALHSDRAKILTVLCSVRNLPRVGIFSPIKFLPHELVRHLGEML